LQYFGFFYNVYEEFDGDEACAISFGVNIKGITIQEGTLLTIIYR
jgi:hypothetical protein